MENEIEKKYLRQKDLAARYGISTTQIYNLVKTGRLPEPMRLHNMKVWPIELIENIDKKNNFEYFQYIGPEWSEGMK